MKHINLIPWRAQAREQHKREFINILAASMVTAVLIIAIVHFILANAISNQNSINNIYQQEITRLNQQLTVITQLKKQQQAIVERINIIDKLQANRSQVVNIFTDMVKALPQGLYLTSMKRIGDAITLTGKAESNARISMFMRNLEALSWLDHASLTQIQTSPAGGAYSNDFVLELQLKPLQGIEDEMKKVDAKKPAQNKAAAKTLTTKK